MTEGYDETREEPAAQNPELGQDTMAEEPQASEPELTEVLESETATVDVITGDRKVTMSTPVKEFEEFKDSFKAMMVAFGNFIEVAGLEIGKNETDVKINAMALEIEKLREVLAAEQDKIREQLVSKDEFDGYKNDNEEKLAKDSEDYVRRREFERFREAVKEVF